jgi:hypothetical protein
LLYNQIMKNPHPFRIVLLLALLAGLLSACDPYSLPYLVVYRVSIYDQRPYLRSIIKRSFGLGMGDPEAGPYYASPDEGQSWQEVPARSEDLPPAIMAPESSQSEACVPQEPQVCYRLTYQPAVKISTDGGQSWQVDWQMPPGRQGYMLRQPELEHLLGVTPDTIPYDLTILETGDGYVVIVAYGNQGVLVKSTSGEWNRIAVRSADEEIRPAAPLPYQVTDFNEVTQALQSENTWIFLLTADWAILLAAVGWLGLAKKTPDSKNSRQDWFNTIIVLSIIAFVILVMLFGSMYQDGKPGDWSLMDEMIVCGSVLYLIIGGIVVLTIAGKLPNGKAVGQAGRLALALALAFFVLTWLPLGLWAWGIIPDYSLALSVVGILALLTMALSLWVQIRFVQRVPSQLPAEVENESPIPENTDDPGDG